VCTAYTASSHRKIRLAKALRTVDDLVRLRKLTLITAAEFSELFHVAGMLLYSTHLEELMYLSWTSYASTTQAPPSLQSDRASTAR
jgi:hypothetical protein